MHVKVEDIRVFPCYMHVKVEDIRVFPCYMHVKVEDIRVFPCYMCGGGGIVGNHVWVTVVVCTCMLSCTPHKVFA